jgi:hypothetical protein
MHGLHWDKLGKALVVKLILLRINKVIGKGLQTPINLNWKDNSVECNISSCNEEMTTLLDHVNSNNMRHHEQSNHQQVSRIDGINLRRTSVRQ